MTANRERTITEIVRQYGGRLMRFIQSRVDNLADAEDIMQDVWYQLSKGVDAENIEQLSGWLFRVARNRMIDRNRKQKAETVGDLADDDDENDAFLEEMLFSEPDTPESEFTRRLFWQQLTKALDELPEEQRQVFVWNELEDQTFREISERTGVNVKTLISRKGYAVKQLRRRLADWRDAVE
jgi:RNA polymerase sigma factor (sigma-70 family)